MNKLIKGLIGFVVVVLLAVVAAGAYLSRNLPGIIQASVETYGPRATGTKVTLGNIQLIYGTGRVVLKDLIVGNPPGFKTDHAFHLGKLAFQLNLPSVLADTVVIDEFSISDANIIAEQVGTSFQTNIQQISDNAQTQGKQTKNLSQSKKETGESDVKLVINQFNFLNGSIDLVSEQWGNRTVALPDIRLKDIGKKEGGLTSEQLSQYLIEQVTKQTNKAVRDELEKIAKEKAKDKFSTKLKEKFNSLFN